MPVNKELLKILCCPHCRGDFNEEKDYLVCTVCKLKYEIKNDIPVLLVEKAILPPGIKNLSDLKNHTKDK